MSVWRGRGRRYGFFSAEAEDGRGKGEQPQVRTPQKEIKDYYQYIYDEVLPSAIQYGMPLNEFWHGDLRLLEAYRKAYIRNVCFVAWKQGDYNRIAMEIGAKNALATKKSEHIDRWIEFIDPIEKIEKAKLKEKQQDDNVTQHNQNMWFYNMLHNK